MMKQSKDPFEVAFDEQDESPPESPIGPDESETQTPALLGGHGNDTGTSVHPSDPSTSAGAGISIGNAGPIGKSKEDDDEEEEENMEIELGKFPTGGDPDKLAKMQAILSQFTEEQMNRYESFRRSGFQKANMKRLLTSITGSSKINQPMTIVVSGIAKMFVGELVESARMVMTEREKKEGQLGPAISGKHIED